MRKLRLNEDIRAEKIRLIDVSGQQIGIVPREVALMKAKEQGLDLLEIASNVDPPVCKLVDYGKYAFQLGKKRTVAKKKQKRMQIKKLRIRPSIDEGDYQVKLRNLQRFLEEGDKVEVSVQFRRRELIRKAQRDFGFEILGRIERDLAEFADIEQKQDKQAILVLVPKKVRPSLTKRSEEKDAEVKDE